MGSRFLSEALFVSGASGPATEVAGGAEDGCVGSEVGITCVLERVAYVFSLGMVVGCVLLWGANECG